jgi:spoIIIJ-associated protein
MSDPGVNSTPAQSDEGTATLPQPVAGPDTTPESVEAATPGGGDDQNDARPELADVPEPVKGAANPLEAEAEIAADYLEELLDIADLDGDIDTYIEGDRAHVSIVSGSTALVGAHGQVLDALQELTRLAVMTETGDRSRLMLDVAGYRETRRQELQALAADAVSSIGGGQDRVLLEPMNPFERKIVHDAVASAGLHSESQGEEPQRRVVVLPAG